MVYEAQWDHWLGLGHHSGDPRSVPRGDLRVVYVILMTEMILEGDSCEKSCWKWSRRYSMTTDRSMGNHNVILG